MLHRSLLALIARVGAFGVTHRALAREANVSLSATTYYFKSKQDMVRKAFLYLSEELRKTLGQLVEQYGESDNGSRIPDHEAAALGQFVRGRLQAEASENLTLIELMLTAARDEEVRRLLSEDREAVRSVVVALMRRSRSSQPDEDTDLVMALVTGLVLESLARGRPADFEARAIAITERVMRTVVAIDRGDNPRTGRPS